MPVQTAAKKDERAFLPMRIKEIAALHMRYGSGRMHVLPKLFLIPRACAKEVGAMLRAIFT